MRLNLSVSLVALAISSYSLAAPTSQSSSAVQRRADPYTLTVSASTTQDADFGTCVFIENNINSGTDGGLYAELIKSRAFSEGDGITGSWTGSNAELSIITTDAISDVLPRSMVIANPNNGKAFGARNGGFFGIGVKAGSYDVSFYARANTPASTTFTVGLYNADESFTFGTSNVEASITSDWKQFETTIQVSDTASDSNNVFGIDLPSEFTDSFQVNLLSVFPSQTWKGTGVREDAGSLINDLKAKYFRAIGGNALEGNNLGAHYDWQKAIGPLTDRAGRPGTWVGWDTDGFSIVESLEFAESIGAKPIPGLFAGYTLDQKAVAESDLQPYITSVINELHYLTDAQGSSDWAKLRESHGRAQPINVPLAEIGNEDWISEVAQTTYSDYRYGAFFDALSTEFPEITFISSSANVGNNKLVAEDRHDYQTPQWFLENHNLFNTSDHVVYELEASVLNSGKCAEGDNLYTGDCRLTYPIQLGAAAEMAFMLGMERNPETAKAFAYAPLISYDGHNQWQPDLISIDEFNSYPSTSYWAQYAMGNFALEKLYDVTSSGDFGPLYWSAGVASGKDIIKFANPVDSPTEVTVQVESGGKYSAEGDLFMTHNDDGYISNDPSNRNAVVPVKRSLTDSDFKDGAFTFTLPAYSLLAVRLTRA